jgi:hypothetical protein
MFAGLSLFTVLLGFSLHLYDASDIGTAISYELIAGNPLAYLLMIALAVALGVFAGRLYHNGYRGRVAVLLILFPCLITITVFPPSSAIHEHAFILLTYLSLLWFACAGVIYERRSLFVGAIGSVFFMPFLTTIGVGIAEKALILICLLGMNLIYYHHSTPERRPCVYWHH